MKSQATKTWLSRLLTLVVMQLCFTTMSWAQTKTVTGTILDASGDPVIGANVVINGTKTGTITDIDGKFSLTNVPERATLKVSYIGYASQEVNVAGKRTLNITLEEDNDQLEEVVVVGYGVQKKRDLTGAISSVKSEDIKMSPVSNAMEALQGKVAGLDIARTSGQIGASPNVLLRGNRSLSASNEPLYIIDGIAGSISSVNPNDIQNIEVLKDASSTAIYGSAGANGVILVTTKQASQGKVQVDFDSYWGINTQPSYPSALKGQAWVDYLQAGYEADKGAKAANLTDLFAAWGMTPDALIPYYDAGKHVDWIDEALQTGVNQNYSFSIRGGTEKVQAYLSAGYNMEEGVYPNDNNRAYTMRAGATFAPNRYVKVGIQTSFRFQHRNSRSSRLNKAFSTIPLGDVFDEDGNIKPYPIDGVSDKSAINLRADDAEGVYKKNSKSLGATINPFVEITPLKGLTLRSQLGTSLSASRTGEFSNEHTYMALTGSSNASKNASYATSMGYNYTWQNILTYHKNWNNEHDLTATALSEWSHSQSESGTESGEQIPYDSFLWFNLGSASGNKYIGSSYTQKKMMSYALRLNYSYLGRYLVSVSTRWDGASQLVDQWDAFPAFSLGWRISDEKWMEGAKTWLDNLKLRAGWGVAGNSNIAAYATRTETAASSNKLNLGAGQVSDLILKQSIGNVDLGWEKSYNTNIGLDIAVLKNRIDLTAEWYNSSTKGVLYNRKLPSAYGVYNASNPYTMYQNIAQTQNRGVELTLNTRNVETKNFKWSSTVTFAANSEKVKGIDLGSGTTVDDLISLGLFLGHPVHTSYGLRNIGVWQLDEEADAAVFGCVPGMAKLEVPGLVHDGAGHYYMIDEEGNKTEYNAENKYNISDKDRQILGHSTPSWTLGFQNNFTYKWFDLSVFTTMRWGQTIGAGLLGFFGYGNSNIPDNYDYWTPENPTNDFPQPRINNVSGVKMGSLSTVDGSYLKIKNITLGYTLPQRLARKAGIQRMRLYGTVYNPLIWAKDHRLDGMDPETNGSDSFPLYKTMVFGLNLSF